jgi:tight adherence protein B
VTVSALALALALMVAPGRARGGAVSRRSSRSAPPRVWLITGSAAAAVAVALLAPMAATAAGLVVTATLAARHRRSRERVRRSREAAVLQSALGVLVGELRVGAHPVVAFEAAAAEVNGDVADSLLAVAARARLGADVAGGLRAVAAHSALSGHWKRLAVCWHLAQTHGLAIVALVSAAQRDIVERERFASRVGAGMAGARATATILAGLPLLGVGLGQLLGAGPVRFLLSGGLGGWLLLIGVSLACAGLWWSDRITERVVG